MLSCSVSGSHQVPQVFPNSLVDAFSDKVEQHTFNDTHIGVIVGTLIVFIAVVVVIIIIIVLRRSSRNKYLGTARLKSAMAADRIKLQITPTQSSNEKLSNGIMYKSISTNENGGDLESDGWDSNVKMTTFCVATDSFNEHDGYPIYEAPPTGKRK